MSAPGPIRQAKNTRSDWATPQWLFDLLDGEFHFTIDGAANEANHKCARWFGPGGEVENAFDAAPEGEVIFLNPPYGRGMDDWAHMAVVWAMTNVVVALVPNATDTKWFCTFWAYAKGVRFLSKRVQFEGTTSSNTAGSTVFVLGPIEVQQPQVTIWNATDE